MIIKKIQAEAVDREPLHGDIKGIEARSIFPEDFIGGSGFHSLSWVEMHPGAEIPEHQHEECEEAKIIVYGHGIYVEEGILEEVGAGDVILTPEKLPHSLTNVGNYPLVYIAVSITGQK